MALTDPWSGEDDTDYDYYDTPSGNIWRPGAEPGQPSADQPGRPAGSRRFSRQREGEAAVGLAGWVHSLPNVAACSLAVQGACGCGGCQRSAPADVLACTPARVPVARTAAASTALMARYFRSSDRVGLIAIYLPCGAGPAVVIRRRAGERCCG